MFDCIVIGAGMAGASVAFELASQARVLLLEAEARPGYHSTGRSAALFTPHYGAPLVRRINAVGADFFRAPPSGFIDRPLLTPRGMLTIAGPGGDMSLDATLAASTTVDPVRLLTAAEAMRLVPLLGPDHVTAAAYESGVMDIDVDALHQAYLKGFRSRGGSLVTDARVLGLAHGTEGWTVATGSGIHTARTLVNAAGAWAGQIGDLAGATRIGLVPMRRTAIVVDGPQGLDTRALPAVEVAGEEPYFKPEAGRIMASLGDETPDTPHDVQADELDIALTADWLERHSTVQVRRVQHSWAGFRSFVPDRVPVLGFDGLAPDFLWLAGQGGYGIMMAPALAIAAATLVRSGHLGDAFDRHDISIAALSPSRGMGPVDVSSPSA